MAERPNADDLANKSERDLAYAWECADRLAEALEWMLHSVCHETGFAAAVRAHSGLAYPWPQLDISEDAARQALAEYRKARG